MKVGMYYSNSDVRVVDMPVPEVGAGEILIKVMSSGICGSDLMEWYRKKRAPLVLGHEIAGEIVETGGGTEPFQVGDRVFATHHVPCGECLTCERANHTACQVFQTVNNFEYGGFAELLKVGGQSIDTGVLKLPDSMSYDTGSFIEPMGTVVRGARTIKLGPEDCVMIIGSGLAGILYAKLARALRVGTVIVSDLSDYRMEMGVKAGAHYSVSPDQDLPEFIRGVNGGRLADKVIICAGSLPAAETALGCVDKGGTILFFAVPRPGETLAVDFNPFWRNDIKLMTSYGAAPVDNRQALDLMRTGAVTVEDMITHRFGLDEIQQAFQIAAEPDGVLKVMIEPNRSA